MSEGGEQPKYCPECKRLKLVACTCGMTFAEKIKSVGINRLWAASSHR